MVISLRMTLVGTGEKDPSIKIGANNLSEWLAMRNLPLIRKFI